MLLQITAIAVALLLGLTPANAQNQPQDSGGFAFPCTPAQGCTGVNNGTNTITAGTGVPYEVMAYGAKCDGTTDDSSKIDAAITAALSAGGGAVAFPNGKSCLHTSQLLIPFTGTSPPKMAGPVRLTGTNPAWDGTLNNQSPTGGSTLILPYAGAGAGKMVAKGIGILELDHMNITNGNAGDTVPLLFASYTTIHSHDNHWVGTTTCVAPACNQDAFVWGGTSSGGGTGDTAQFQGYNSYSENDTFSYMRRAATFNSSANGIKHIGYTVDYTSGDAETNGAPFMFMGIGGGNTGNYVSAGIIELQNYSYCTSFFNGGGAIKNNTVSHAYCGDHGATSQGSYFYATGVGEQNVSPGLVDTSVTLVAGGAATSQSFLSTYNGQRSSFYHGILVDAAGDYSIFQNRMGVMLPASTNPTYNLDIGPGTGTVVERLNGASSGTGAGEYLRLEGGSAYLGAIGNYSSIVGGAYSANVAIDSANKLISFPGLNLVGIGIQSPNFSLEISQAGTYSTNGAGAFAISNPTTEAKKLYMGYDAALGTNGSGFIQSVRTGSAYTPTVINPNGGNVGINGVTAPVTGTEIGSALQLDSTLNANALATSGTAQAALCQVSGGGVVALSAGCGLGTGFTTAGTGLGQSGSTVSSNAVEHVSYQPGLLTAVNATKAVFHKFSKAATVDNIEGSAATFSCVSNPTITMYECGTSASCSSTPTTIGTVTVTSAGTVVDGTVSAPAITAGDYVAFSITAGTCASIDIAATAQVHSN